MKKLSFLIALCMLLTIGGVYATWTYTRNVDVTDESVNMSLALGSVAYGDGYGTYVIDRSNLDMTIDPKDGTDHNTALYITGNIVVTFTPSSHSPEDVKENGVSSTYTLSLSNANWKYNGQDIVTLNNVQANAIQWTKNSNGTFSFTLTAEDLAEHIALNTFTLDTKAKYDAYNTVLGQGSIVFTVSDGITTTP